MHDRIITVVHDGKSDMYNESKEDMMARVEDSKLADRSIVVKCVKRRAEQEYESGRPCHDTGWASHGRKRRVTMS